MSEQLHDATLLDSDAGKAEAVTEVRREAALLKTGALQNAIFNSANFSSIATDERLCCMTLEVVGLSLSHVAQAGISTL